jgi:hypothetical protein
MALVYFHNFVLLVQQQFINLPACCFSAHSLLFLFFVSVGRLLLYSFSACCCFKFLVVMSIMTLPAREKSLFWHRMWLDCDRPKQGAVADAMR